MTITTTPYCVADDVLVALGRTDTTDVPFITSLIPQAQQMIDRHLGYSFQLETTTKLFDGSGAPKLFVGEIQSFSSVLSVVQPGFDNTFTFIITPATSTDITADCVLSPARCSPAFQLTRRSGEWFSPGVQNVTVTGIFGYSAVPYDVERACIRLVVHMLKMRDTNYVDVVADQGGINQRFLKRMPDDVADILQFLTHRNFYSR